MADLHLPYSVRDDRGIAFEGLIARLDALPRITVDDLATTPAVALDALAWGFDMLGVIWSHLDTDEKKRAFLADVYHLQGRRGTPWAVMTALEYLGFPGVTLRERFQGIRYNGAISHNGREAYGGAPEGPFDYWAKIPLTQVWTAAWDALVRRVVADYAPLRSRLTRLWLLLPTVTQSVAAAEPDWMALRFAVSADGVTWIPRLVSNATESTGTVSLDCRAYNSDALDATITHLSLIRADNSIVTQTTIPAITKCAGTLLTMTWTLTWSES